VTVEQFDEVLAELRKISRLLTLLLTRDLSQRDKIALLSTAGFQPKEIAELIGTTPNTVSVTLSTIRRDSAKGKARSRRQHD
jgi:DNA-binding CsgD family transcriptional regulator